jgi:indolepyruvate ferredoxin oxidoreductase beta subunit
VVLAVDQVEVNGDRLRPGGVLLGPQLVASAALTNRKSLNVALLGALSMHLEINEAKWRAAIRACLPEKLHAANEQAFDVGRRVLAARKPRQ